MEFRWDGPAQVKKLGDDPSKGALNALFAIPGDTKSDSSLPHHSVSSDGKVGAADKDGCIAAISALNGARGGVSASAGEKNKAYSHLASHLRAMGVDPPAKQFAAGNPAELRIQRRSSMLRVPERLALQFGASGIEMRAKANGTGGTKFTFNGYFLVFDHPFEMWDFWGDQFSEIVDPVAITRTLANKCDVPFLIGHNDAGIPMARTKSGTMTLGADSHGGWVNIPDLDGSREDVRALASAHDRGDMDEMSCAFQVLAQQWSPDYMERRIMEMDLHKGDVSAVVFGANDGTAGSSMVALPAESLSLRRPTGIRQRGTGEQRLPTQPYTRGEGETATCPQCQSGNDTDAIYCDQCGTSMPGQVTPYWRDPGDTQQCRCGAWNAPDAKVCDQCGQSLVNDHDEDDGYGSYGDRRPAERRAGGSSDDTPDYDPQPHAIPGEINCPSPDCTVEGGAMNSPDAKFCDQCSAPLYDEDGTIIVSDDGVPSEIEGGDLATGQLARARAGLELRRRQLELLSAS